MVDFVSASIVVAEVIKFLVHSTAGVTVVVDATIVFVVVKGGAFGWTLSLGFIAMHIRECVNTFGHSNVKIIWFVNLNTQIQLIPDKGRK